MSSFSCDRSRQRTRVRKLDRDMSRVACLWYQFCHMSPRLPAAPEVVGIRCTLASYLRLLCVSCVVVSENMQIVCGLCLLLSPGLHAMTLPWTLRKGHAAGI